ncbi:hypothetical protein [Trueperella pyogenes]|uniref:hypothetical protein n=1 Tax=Trueperella pyogenes TaxID=1661 RepID=UPI00345DB79A
MPDDAHRAHVDSIGALIFLEASRLSSFSTGWLIMSGDASTYLRTIAMTVIPALIVVLTFSPKHLSESSI